VFRLSCADREGVADFRRRLFTLVPEPEAEEQGEDDLADFLVYKPKAKGRQWRLLRTEGGFRVLGAPPPEEELERCAARGRREGRRHGRDRDEEFELA